MAASERDHTYDVELTYRPGSRDPDMSQPSAAWDYDSAAFFLLDVDGSLFVVNEENERNPFGSIKRGAWHVGENVFSEARFFGGGLLECGPELRLGSHVLSTEVGAVCCERHGRVALSALHGDYLAWVKDERWVTHDGVIGGRDLLICSSAHPFVTAPLNIERDRLSALAR